MNDLVHSIVHKRLSALRLPSFAGRGLPERMRSTAFALLGMTAAAALFLVAIFAQLNFPLIEPAPLPDEPSTHLAGAERVTRDRSSGGSVSSAAPARVAGRGSRPGESSTGSPSAANSSPAPAAAVPGSSTSAPAPSATPTPGGADAPAAKGTGSGGGDSISQPVSPPPAGQAPDAAPQASGGGSVPAPSPSPVTTPPKATTSVPTPVAPPAPGNSSSTAAAEHASDRGIEASSSNAAAESVVAEPSADPGNGNGLAKGQSK